jgi:hypothetical protein
MPAATPMATSAMPSYMADVNAACGECADFNTNCCDTLCGPPGRLWFGAEYLLWTTKGNRLPALATTGPIGTAGPTSGALGAPGTSTLIGDRDYNDDWRSGFRITGGLWLDQRQLWGVEGDYFYLGNSSTSEIASSDGSRIITRPFTNNVIDNRNGTFTPTTPFADTQLVSFPNVLAGQIAVNTQSEFTGAGVNVMRNLLCADCARLDFIVGYRYLNLNDTLNIQEDLRGLPGSQNDGFTFRVNDNFRTENHFHGVNLGLAGERRFGAFFMGGRATVALGNTHSIVDIDGSTVITNPNGVSQRFSGGLLTQPSNIGRYTLNKFATVTEVGMRLGVQLTENVRLYGGYNFIYWTNVIRTGDVIDTRVNASQIPPRTNPTGELFPRFSPRYSDFWAHGIVIGAQVRY